MGGASTILAAMAAPLAAARSLLLLTGPGNSGESLLSGLAVRLGWVEADATGVHGILLEESGLDPDDPRPQAWATPPSPSPGSKSIRERRPGGRLGAWRRRPARPPYRRGEPGRSPGRRRGHGAAPRGRCDRGLRAWRGRLAPRDARHRARDAHAAACTGPAEGAARGVAGDHGRGEGVRRTPPGWSHAGPGLPRRRGGRPRPSRSRSGPVDPPPPGVAARPRCRRPRRPRVRRQPPHGVRRDVRRSGGDGGPEPQVGEDEACTCRPSGRFERIKRRLQR
jgi:hypothetical protein